MKRKKITIYVILVAICTSCYRDINLEDYRSEAMIVLNSIATPDTVVMADISRTWFFTDNEPAKDITGLKVELYIDSQLKEIMEYNGEKYVSTTHPQEGNVIRIQTQVDGKIIVAEDIVPTLIRLKKVDISHRKISSSGNSSIVGGNGTIIQEGNNEYTYRITFKDEPEKRNYYFIRIEECDSRQNLGTLDYSYDPVFQILSEEVNGSLTNQTISGQFGLPFSDQGIDGMEYTLTIKEIGPDSYYKDYGKSCYRRIRLYSLSEAYYRYLLSLLSNDSDNTWQGGMSDIGIAEPVTIYSNIQGGVGILGCQQQVSQLKDLKGM